VSSNPPLSALVRQVNRGPGDVPDADLIDRFVRTADQAAFELLVWRHGAMVWGVCQRMLDPDRAAAEDACQAVFVALATHAARLRDRTAVGAWLHRSAVRAALDLGRAAARLPAADPPEPLAHDPDPIQYACDRETRFLLDTGLDRLPDKLRRPFVLCELEGRTNAEVAAALGCPVGTVESRLTRARQRLRDWLTARGVVPAVAAGAVAVPDSVRAAMIGASDPAKPSATVKALALRAIPPALPVSARSLIAAGVVLVAGAIGLGATLGEPPGPEQPPPKPYDAKALSQEELRFMPPAGPNGTGDVIGAHIVEAQMLPNGRVSFFVRRDGTEPVQPPDITAAIDGKEVRAVGVDGKPLDVAELKRRLTRWTAVVILPSDLELPKDYYRKVLNERTVIFLVPKPILERMAKAAAARRKADDPQP
jgi:RNA polymerase sigma factor (sigma-70 family)